MLTNRKVSRHVSHLGRIFEGIFFLMLYIMSNSLYFTIMKIKKMFEFFFSKFQDSH